MSKHALTTHLADLASADGRVVIVRALRPAGAPVGGEDGGPRGGMPSQTDLRPPREHRLHRKLPHVVKGWGEAQRACWAAAAEARVGWWVGIWSIADGCDACDEAPGPAACLAREGVDFKDLLQQRRLATGGLGRRESYRAGDWRTNPGTVS